MNGSTLTCERAACFEVALPGPLTFVLDFFDERRRRVPSK